MLLRQLLVTFLLCFSAPTQLDAQFLGTNPESTPHNVSALAQTAKLQSNSTHFDINDFIARRKHVNSTETLAVAATLYTAAELMGNMLDRFKIRHVVHQAVHALNSAPESVQCAWSDSERFCFFNPAYTNSPKFPAAVLPIEGMLRHVALSHYHCKSRLKEHTCLADTMCTWEGDAEGCSFGHDLHNNIAETLHHCMDSLYHRRHRMCFNVDKPTEATCQLYSSCRLYTAARDGVPQDVCLPDHIKSPLKAYQALHARRVNKTFVRSGFGSCHAASLQHAAHTYCKHNTEASCYQDTDCSVLRNTASGTYCVISSVALRREYFNGSRFLEEYDKAYDSCSLSETQVACHALNTELRPRAPPPPSAPPLPDSHRRLMAVHRAVMQHSGPALGFDRRAAVRQAWSALRQLLRLPRLRTRL